MWQHNRPDNASHDFRWNKSATFSYHFWDNMSVLYIKMRRPPVWEAKMIRTEVSNPHMNATYVKSNYRQRLSYVHKTCFFSFFQCVIFASFFLLHRHRVYARTSQQLSSSWCVQVQHFIGNRRQQKDLVAVISQMYITVFDLGLLMGVSFVVVLYVNEMNIED